jgi:hypothetical protein
LLLLTVSNQNSSKYRSRVQYLPQRKRDTSVKVSKVKLSRYRHADAKGKRTYSSDSLLTSVLDGVSGQHHAPAALYPQEWTPGTHCIEGWVGLRAGLDTGTRGKIICIYRGSNTPQHHKNKLIKAVWEIITVYSENHTKPVNTFCRQNAELLIIKAGGTCGYQWGLKGEISRDKVDWNRHTQAKD